MKCLVESQSNMELIRNRCTSVLDAIVKKMKSQYFSDSSNSKEKYGGKVIEQKG